MALSSAPSSLCRIALQCLSRPTGLRCVRMSAFKLDKAQEELKRNPYYGKYANKISSVQKESPEEFEARLKQLTREKIPKKVEGSSQRGKMSGPGMAKPTLNNQGLKPHSLNDVVKMDLLKDKSPEEIKFIWSEYHRTKDVVYATLEPSLHRVVKEKSAKYPLFLFPLPRSQGYEFIVCQFTENAAHFTPLVSYQAHGENSPECLTLLFFEELAESKGLVLMKGEYDKNVLSALDAQCLANCLQLYYGEDNPRRVALLERFTHRPDDFKYMDLVAEIDLLNIAINDKGSKNPK